MAPPLPSVPGFLPQGRREKSSMNLGALAQHKFIKIRVSAEPCSFWRLWETVFHAVSLASGATGNSRCSWTSGCIAPVSPSLVFLCIPMSLLLKEHQSSLIVLCLSCFSHVRLFAALWTVARQVPLSMRFSRQEYWSGLPYPPPGNLPNPGIEPESLRSPALAGSFFTTSATGEAPSLITALPNDPSLTWSHIQRPCFQIRSHS